MRLVLDTNILIAALIKDSLTRKFFFFPDLELLLPEYALEEVNRHRAKIARHSRLTYREIDLLLSLLLESVTVVPAKRILPHLMAADALIGDIDKDDVPFVALALAMENDGIWSNDRAFENLPGIKLWKTPDIKAYLQKRS
jgi:predicted nucleic acid-binding protein